MKLWMRNALLILLCLSLCGCSAISSAMGTLGIAVSEVERITITPAGKKAFVIQDNTTIREVVDAVNRLTLEDGAEVGSGWVYTLFMEGNDGNDLGTLTIIDSSTVSWDRQQFSVNAEALLRKVEALYCDTLTDEELLRMVFESSYFDELSLLDENGNLSIDRLLKLSADFPALFELIGRPSALESVTTLGLSLLQEYLESDNNVLRQRAELLAKAIAELLPQWREQIAALITLPTTG